MSSDFVGMGGALMVCVIAQSIVFIALAIMAGVIYLVGWMAGRNDKPLVHPIMISVDQPVASLDSGEDGEIAAVVMGALTVELDRGEAPAKPGQPSSWRLVSLQEAARTGRLK